MYEDIRILFFFGSILSKKLYLRYTGLQLSHYIINYYTINYCVIKIKTLKLI